MNLRKELDHERKNELRSSELERENLYLVTGICVLKKRSSHWARKSVGIVCNSQTSSQNSWNAHWFQGVGQNLEHGKTRAQPQRFRKQWIWCNSGGTTQIHTKLWIRKDSSKRLLTYSAETTESMKKHSFHQQPVSGRIKECFHCGKPGHIKKKCYHYLKKVNQLLKK